MTPEDCVKRVEEILEVDFVDQRLLLQALTHRSYLNEHCNHPCYHNERLEYLGDAVLGLLITEHLYKKFPEVTEGELSEKRAAIVRTQQLSKIANAIGLTSCILTSKGEQRDRERGEPSWEYIPGCVVEAIFGALFLDQGLGACRLLMDGLISHALTKIVNAYVDHKSLLQVFVQEKGGSTPHYRILRESGPDHAKLYAAGCYVDDQLIATGEGKSKREAEIAAAKQARETTPQWERRITELAIQQGSVMRRSKNSKGTNR